MISVLSEEDKKKRLIVDLLRAQEEGRVSSTCQYNHHIHTPFKLTDEICGQIIRKYSAKYLVLFNLEFLYSLNEIIDLELGEVYYYTTDHSKARIVNLLWPQVKILDRLKNGMKFDIIVGNPPYQRENSKAHKLWPEFLQKSIDMAKGHIYMVTPVLFASGGGSKIQAIRNSAFPKLSLISFEANKHFSVGETICWFHLDMNKVTTGVNIKYIDGTEDILATVSLSGIMLGSDKLATSIIEKVEKSNHPRIKLVSDYASTDGSAIPSVMIPKGIISENKTDEYCYEFIHSGAQIYYAKSPHIYGGRNKVCLNYSSSYKKMFHSTGVVGKQVEAILVNNIQEAELVIKTLTKKLFLFYIDNEKTGGFNTGIYKLPAIDLSRSWTDKELYDHFNLTEEERLHIDPEYKA